MKIPLMYFWPMYQIWWDLYRFIVSLVGLPVIIINLVKFSVNVCCDINVSDNQDIIQSYCDF